MHPVDRRIQVLIRPDDRHIVDGFLTLKAGFPYYGYGYFFATITTFAAAFLTAAYYLKRLPYQTFVMSNSSVEVAG